MSDRDALLRAILDNPEDDAPRLIFADYIDERGEPEYAEFIRLQIELVKWEVFPGDRPRAITLQDGKTYRFAPTAGLIDRERELVKSGFLRSFPWPFYRNENEYGFSIYGRNFQVVPRRGFADHITCTAANAILHLDTILAEHPVQEVTLTTWPLRTCDQQLCNLADTLPIGSAFVTWGLEGRSLKHIFKIEREQDKPNIRQLLTLEWPRIKKWNLPEYSPSPLRAAFSVWQEARDAQAYSMRHF